MESINYTFIIPHKNIPDLLQRCLNSIPRREDIQIIVVDDNSDPEKVDFEHFPGVGEPCVEVYFTKEGKGAGYARNVGLKHIKGRWLLFADADDYFLPNLLLVLDKHLLDVVDIIYFEVESRFSNTNERANRNEFFNSLLSNIDINNKYSIGQLKYKHVVPWGKMIRSQIVVDNHCLFEEVQYGNDVMFAIYVASYVKTISIDKVQVYCVTVRENSLTEQISFESFCVRYIRILNKNKYLRSIGERQYESRIMPLLYDAFMKYGVKAFCKVIKLSFMYKVSLLEECKYCCRFLVDKVRKIY